MLPDPLVARHAPRPRPPRGCRWAAYEAAGAASVRASVGQSVSLRLPNSYPLLRRGTAIEGTLVKAHYRFNDKWGFFDVYVKIEGNKGSIATGLRPSDLKTFSKAAAPAR